MSLGAKPPEQETKDMKPFDLRKRAAQVVAMNKETMMIQLSLLIEVQVPVQVFQILHRIASVSEALLHFPCAHFRSDHGTDVLPRWKLQATHVCACVFPV